MMNTLLTPEMWESSGSTPPPPELAGVFRGIYVFSGLIILTLVGANIAAALFLKKRTNRMFLLIVSGINCLNMPLGTVLGVFTIIVLTKPHIFDHFEKKQPS